MADTKNILLKAVGTLFGLFLICFILVNLYALGTFLYSTPSVEPVPEKDDMPPEKFSKSIEKTFGADHFHILDETVYSDVENAPICLACHGNFCHVKSEMLRSFYNMHTFFLACETCHIRASEGEAMLFRWFDDKTGEVVDELEGTVGNYGAKIVPVKNNQRLDAFPKEALALDYMKLKDTYTEDEKKRIRDELMEHIAQEPITCEECHCKESYLNYTDLGYSFVRSFELSRIEIVKISKEYEEFHLPTMFDPSVVKGERGGN
jgi:hypothetical protein